MSKEIQPETVPPGTSSSHVEQAGKYVEGDDPHRAAIEDNPDHAEKLSWSTCAAVFFLALSYVGPLSFGVSLVGAMLVTISTDLGDTSTMTWIIGGGGITSSVSLTIAGQASDIFGRRWTVIGGQLFSIVGFIVGATAKSTNDVIVAGCLNGFGVGFVFTSYAGIAEMVPNKWRGFGIGFTETCMTIPWIGGAVIIGNLLASKTAAGWRWIYYIALIYNGVSLIGNFLFYFPPSRPQQDYEKTRWQELKEQDFIGIILYSAGVAVLLVGLTWGGTTGHAWGSASVLAPIILGIAVFFAAFAYDFTLAKNPVFPLFLFRKWMDYSILLVVIFVAGAVYFAMVALLPQATLYMFTSDPIQIGLIQLPNGIGQVFFGGLASLFIGKIKHLKAQLIFYLVIQTLFLGLYSAVVPYNKAAWMALQFFGMGVFPTITVLCYVIAGLNVSLKHLGLASGLLGTFRSLGASVGNSIYSTIMTELVNKQLPDRIAQVAIAQGLDPSTLSALIPATIENAVGVPGAFSGLPEVTPTIVDALSDAFKESYAYAFRRVFWGTIPLGVLAIGCSLFINDPSKYLTNHVAIHMEQEGILGKAKVVEHSDGSKEA